MNRPLIYLAFSNHKDQYLKNLDKERKEIKEVLSSAIDEGKIILEHESATAIHDIFGIFDKYRGRVKIFHYGGHADMEHLVLYDKNAQGKAIADLFAEENKLGGMELVFLNGCATQGHVKKILEVGVKAVLATAVKVNDQTATKFAIQFYQSFASGAGVDEAYHKATARVKAELSDEEDRFAQLGEIRHSEALPDHKETLDANQFPWALYTQKGDEANLKWSLNNIVMSNLESFKEELLVLVNSKKYAEVFQKIENSNYEYDQFFFNHLRDNITFSESLALVNQLKVYIGSIK